jgi:hypothetical protein
MSPQNWIAVTGIVISSLLTIFGWLVTGKLVKKPSHKPKARKPTFITPPSAGKLTRLLLIAQAGTTSVFTIFLIYQAYLQDPEYFKGPSYLRTMPLAGVFVFGTLFARSVFLLMRARKK